MKVLNQLFSLAIFGLFLANGAVSSVQAIEPNSLVLKAGTGVFNWVSPRSGKQIRVFYVKSADYDVSTPPVMVFHGQQRNADEYRDGWVELSEKHKFLVLAPELSRELYPRSSSYNLGNLFEAGSEMVANPEAEWSFRVPDDLFDFVCEQGITRASSYYAFGHSAGSQFLHRKVAYSPDPQLAMAVAANAGWYTFPTLDQRWPYGYAGTALSEAELRDYLQFPLRVLLGEEDKGLNDSGLRKTPEAMEQGAFRLERGKSFFAFSMAQAERWGVPFAWELATVPGVAHEGQKMAPSAAAIFAEATSQANASSLGLMGLQLIALLVIVGTVFLLIRHYQTHATLLFAGMLLISLVFLFSNFSGQSLKHLTPPITGWRGFDIFALITDAMASRVGKIGLIVMAAGGFARYMSSIAASDVLVSLVIVPLKRIQSPYVLLALSYIIGQLLNVFIPSAAGLAMLLLVALYPTLIRLGLSPISVASVIGTTAALDLGPASGASNVAANMCGLEPAVYFVRYQVPLALVVIPTVAILHFVWQRYLDKKSGESKAVEFEAPEGPGCSTQKAPVIYGLLPILPLGFLVVFSPLVVSSVQVDVVTAMLIGLFVGLVFESVRLKSLKKALEGIVSFFEGMGEVFTKVVTLIVAAEVFATGIKATGLIDSLISYLHSGGYGSFTMVIFLVLLLGFTAVVTGSGNASLFSFANLVPGIAKTMGVQSVSLMLPAQFAASLFRSMSPVAGVIIAVANAASVSPFAIVKRTSVPLAGGVLVMVILQRFLF